MDTLRSELVEVIRRIGARGWCPATSGNFSVRLGSTTSAGAASGLGGGLRVLMTPSGIDKSRIAPEELIEVTGEGLVVAGGLAAGRGAASARVSAEFALHAAIYGLFPVGTGGGGGGGGGAGAILHTHSVANTVLSRRMGGAVVLRDLELLKALSGVSTHEHEEIVPVFANSQDMGALAGLVRRRLEGMKPAPHGFLLAGHGLYTWGSTLDDAYRHLEAFEFLFEVLLRQ